MKNLFVALLFVALIFNASAQWNVNGELYPSFQADVTNELKSNFYTEGFVSVNYLGDNTFGFVESKVNGTGDIYLYQAQVGLNFQLSKNTLSVYGGKFQNPWQGAYRNGWYNVNRSNTVGLLPETYMGIGLSGTLSKVGSCDVIIGNYSDTVKTVFADINLSYKGLRFGAFINGNIGNGFEHPYMGGKLGFVNKGLDVLVEGIFQSTEDDLYQYNARGALTYRFPKNNFGLFGEYLNHDFGGVTAFGMTGAVLYVLKDIDLSAGWNGYKNNIADTELTHLVFISAGYKF